jgi:hypothetical protein
MIRILIPFLAGSIFTYIFLKYPLRTKRNKLLSYDIPTKKQIDKRFSELSLNALTTLDHNDFHTGFILLRSAYTEGGMWHYLATHGNLNGIYMDYQLNYHRHIEEDINNVSNTPNMSHWYNTVNPNVLASRESHQNLINMLKKNSSDFHTIAIMKCGTAH